MENFPSNSRRAHEGKPEKKEPKKVEKIVEGQVVRRKKSLGKRFKETFIGGDDAGSVWGYVLNDVLIPAAKDMISDAVSQGMERMIFGEVRRGGSPRSRSSSSFTSYNRYGQPGPMNRREDPRRDSRPELSRRARASHDFDEIIIPTKVEAEEVIDGLFTLIQQYETVTVADLYEMVGQTGDFTDEKWGWTDLRGAGVTRVKGGYLLDLPKTEPLD